MFFAKNSNNDILDFALIQSVIFFIELARNRAFSWHQIESSKAKFEKNIRYEFTIICLLLLAGLVLSVFLFLGIVKVNVLLLVPILVALDPQWYYFSKLQSNRYVFYEIVGRVLNILGALVTFVFDMPIEYWHFLYLIPFLFRSILANRGVLSLEKLLLAVFEVRPNINELIDFLKVTYWRFFPFAVVYSFWGGLPIFMRLSNADDILIIELVFTQKLCGLISVPASISNTLTLVTSTLKTGWLTSRRFLKAFIFIFCPLCIAFILHLTFSLKMFVLPDSFIVGELYWILIFLSISVGLIKEKFTTYREVKIFEGWPLMSGLLVWLPFPAAISAEQSIQFLTCISLVYLGYTNVIERLIKKSIIRDK